MYSAGGTQAARSGSAEFGGKRCQLHGLTGLPDRSHTGPGCACLAPAGKAARKGSPRATGSPIAWYTIFSKPSMIFLWERCVVTACPWQPSGRSRPCGRPYPISRFFSRRSSHMILSCTVSFCAASTCTKHSELLRPLLARLCTMSHQAGQAGAQ